MLEIRGNVLPVYVVADESQSMTPVVDELNIGLATLHDALLREPMAAAKVRFTILGFSDTVVAHVEQVDLRRESSLPKLTTRASTSYGAAFRALADRIPKDIASLKAQGYACHRPAVFFLTDGQPTDDGDWESTYDDLTNREVTKAAPNIIACGIGEAKAATILRIATRPEFAFVAAPSTELGLAIAEFCGALTRSIVASGRALGAGNAELVVEKPDTFTMAIDVV
ncbi:MAG TPA: hypothetical protein VH352_04835 [Pseudonocardiaceae bacterium]|nr:hypothetical protein [Pseudonocardiaceae bacterium]